MAWRPELCTTFGVLHGGAVISMADSLGAVSAFLNLPAGATTSTIESKTNFFRGVREGRCTQRRIRCTSGVRRSSCRPISSTIVASGWPRSPRPRRSSPAESSNSLGWAGGRRAECADGPSDDRRARGRPRRDPPVADRHGRLALIVRAPDRRRARGARRSASSTSRSASSATRGQARPSRETADGTASPTRQLNIMNARAAELIAGDIERWPPAGDQLYVDVHLGGEELPPGTHCGSGRPSSK